MVGVKHLLNGVLYQIGCGMGRSKIAIFSPFSFGDGFGWELTKLGIFWNTYQTTAQFS